MSNVLSGLRITQEGIVLELSMPPFNVSIELCLRGRSAFLSESSNDESVVNFFAHRQRRCSEAELKEASP